MSDDRYRCSFDTVADTYESGRPPYADEAVHWIAGRLPAGRVLDLAAGTGKLTRQLVALGLDVVAVEPGDEMRRVLARVLPDVEALAGTAEAIPLPDASVDAVTVGQAFHWFRPDEAFAELHRVLRPGGGVALLWNVWNDDDPLLRRVDEVLAPLRPPAARDVPLEVDRDRFGEPEQRRFVQARRLTTDALVAWVASTSAVSTAPAAERDGILDRVRELAGADVVDVAVATDVVVLDRVS